MNNVSDLSQIAELINLKRFYTGWGSSISDLSPLAGLTRLEEINISAGKVSDLTPLAGLTGLKELHFQANQISDISPLAGLTGLTRLDLGDNNISDISALAGLTNLKWLVIPDNQISDISPLDGFRENITTFVWYGNPAFPEAGPSIEGPWLWVVLPNTRLSHSKDLLLEASGGTVTETEIATHGATVGQPVGDDVWTYRKLPPTDRYNVSRMLDGNINGALLYGTVSLYSPREQDTTIYVGSHNEFKGLAQRVSDLRGTPLPCDVTITRDFFPYHTPARKKCPVSRGSHLSGNGYFGFEPRHRIYSSKPRWSVTLFPKSPIHINDTFTP